MNNEWEQVLNCALLSESLTKMSNRILNVVFRKKMGLKNYCLQIKVFSTKGAEFPKDWNSFHLLFDLP